MDLKRGAKILLAVLALMTVAFPIFAYASHVELYYVDAWQGYSGSPQKTFFNRIVSQLIYEETLEHNINPRLILIMLQKESGAITRSSPSSDTTRAWPLFYGYHERMADCLLTGTNCDNAAYRQRAIDFGGVGQQIAYATYQLRNLHDSGSYCGGSLAVSVDGGTITTDNAASCALYKYTPHVVSYNTDSAFYTNWQSWWSGTPNGGGYSQTNIISEDNFSNGSPMTADQINSFLTGKGSWLGSYLIAEYISVPYPVLVDDTPPPSARKAGDASGDGAVDSTDLSILADQWGKNVSANTGADWNGDGIVDSTDLSILADAWGK